MNINNMDRPKSEEELERVLSKAYGYACRAEYSKALELCDWLIQENSTELAGYRKRAAVREHMGDIDGAISDLQYVVSTISKEPADFYGLGLLQLQRGLTAEAVTSFSAAIEIGDEAGFAYYRLGALLFRAEAYLKLCNYENAINDCSALPEGYSTYMGEASGMRSKENILDEANSALRSKNRKPRG